MEQILILLFSLLYISTVNALRELPYLMAEKTVGDDEKFKMIISMPIVETKESDTYMCYAKPLDEIGESYILSSLVNADAKVAHHISTGFCSEPRHKDKAWDCTRQIGQECIGNAVSFGGWERYIKANSAEYKFPKDVSLKVGGNTQMNFLLISIHYSDPVKSPKSTAANITLEFVKKPTKFNFQQFMLANKGFIPAKSSNGVFTQMGCEWKRPPAFAFRYFVHTHHYGLFTEGFLIRNKTWIYLGGQLTKGRNKVQYDVPNGPIEIRTGDILAARCLYVNKNETPVVFGSRDNEEMCNFQLDIGYDIQYQEHFTRSPACISDSPTFDFCKHEETSGLCSS